MNDKYKEYEEENFLMLSGIQHFEFCQRQWGLIHIENQWEENFLTVDGELMHEKVHDKLFDEKRNGVKYSRGVSIHSRRLGIYGTCDMVEFHDGQVIPIEYKRGKPKEHNADELQLVLQAICLEEMMCTKIEYGFIYYGETKHRIKVDISSDLRNKVEIATERMHDLYSKGYVPVVKTKRECSACSLKEICLPKMLKAISAKKYIDKVLEEIDNEKIT